MWILFRNPPLAFCEKSEHPPRIHPIQFPLGIFATNEIANESPTET